MVPSRVHFQIRVIRPSIVDHDETPASSQRAQGLFLAIDLN